MKIIIYSLLVLTYYSCTENTNIDNGAINEEVKAMIEEYVNHINNNGLKGVDHYFSRDDRFYWVEDGIMQYPDRESLLKGIEAFYPTVKGVNLKISETNIKIIDVNTVSLFIQYKEDIELNSGFSFTLDGAMTILTIREDKTWKFLNGHSSIKKPRGGNSWKEIN